MKTTLTALALTAAIGLAACGGSSNNNDSATAATSHTVSTSNINGANVLVDSKGNALYTNDQDKSGMISCANGCTSIWPPLTTNGKPTAASDVSGSVGVVKRPDGTRQVTLDGKPLYRFAQDGGPGKVNGDGAKDSFGGQQFSWHVVSTGKSSSSSGSSSNGGGGSYSY
jgi:predicted lipoprotein with Yx(FWY)xxD motif